MARLRHRSSTRCSSSLVGAACQNSAPTEHVGTIGGGCHQLVTTNPTSTLKSLVAGLLVTAVCLLALESLARIVATIRAQLAERRQGTGIEIMDPSPKYGWVMHPGFRGIAQETHMRQIDANGFRTVDSAQVADKTRPKVVFIGDSNTFGLDVATEESFVEVADRLLPQADAINLGVPGYTSAQGLLVAKERLPALNPSVVVVSFNFNDRRWVSPSDRPDGPGRYRELARASPKSVPSRIRRALEISYLFRAFEKLLGRGSGTQIPIHLDQVRPRVDAAAYRENLRAIAGVARDLGAKLVFVLLRDDPLVTAPIRRGRELVENGDFADAIRVLSPAAKADNWDADLATLQLARALRGLGKDDEAAQLLARPTPPLIPDGRYPILPDSVYNDVMRDVANEFHAACVDAAVAVEEGPQAFRDTCHFNAAAHHRVGELLAKAIAPLLTESTPIPSGS